MMYHIFTASKLYSNYNSFKKTDISQLILILRDHFIANDNNNNDDDAQVN